MSKLSNRLTSIICLILCAIFIGYTVPNIFVIGLADTKKEVMFCAGVTMFYNAVPFTCVTESGEETVPILDEGTTYVPLATFSKLVGNKFSFNKNSKQIIKSTVEVPIYSTTMLVPLSESKERAIGNNALQRNYTGYVSEVSSVRVLDERHDSLVSGPVTVLLTDTDCYVPLRPLVHSFDLDIEWNDVQGGVDIFTASFSKLLNSVRTSSTDSVMCKISDLSSLRYWYEFNVLFDGCLTKVPFTYYPRGEDECMVRNLSERLNPYVEASNIYFTGYKTIVDSLHLDGLSEEDKVTAIAEYLCNRFEYDSDGLQAGLSDFPRRLSVILESDLQICEGYARAFQMLCKYAGVRCDYIVGWILGGDKTPMCHAWNRVFIDGQWLYCDPTLADLYSDCDKWILKTDEEFKSSRYQYNSSVHY